MDHKFYSLEEAEKEAGCKITDLLRLGIEGDIKVKYFYSGGAYISNDEEDISFYYGFRHSAVLAKLTGLRYSGEICLLTADSVDLNQGVLRIEGREIPMTEQTKRFFNEMTSNDLHDEVKKLFDNLGKSKDLIFADLVNGTKWLGRELLPLDLSILWKFYDKYRNGDQDKITFEPRLPIVVDEYFVYPYDASKGTHVKITLGLNDLFITGRDLETVKEHKAEGGNVNRLRQLQRTSDKLPLLLEAAVSAGIYCARNENPKRKELSQHLKGKFPDLIQHDIDRILKARPQEFKVPTKQGK